MSFIVGDRRHMRRLLRLWLAGQFAPGSERDDLPPSVDVELAKQPRHIVANRARGKVQPPGDFAVCQPLADKCKELSVKRSKRGDGVLGQSRALALKNAHERLGGQHHVPGGGRLDRLDQFARADRMREDARNARAEGRRDEFLSRIQREEQHL